MLKNNLKNIVNKLNLMPIEIKSSFIIFISSFLTQGVSFFTTPIFTRLMSVEEYGLIAQYNSWLSIITVFSTLSLSAGVFQVAMSEYDKDRDKFTFSIMILSNLSTIVVYGIIFIFIDYFKKLFELPFYLILLMFLYNLFYPSMLMWLARQRYEYNYKKVAYISIISTFSSQIIAIIFVLIFKDKNLGVIKLWSSSGIVIIFSLVIYFSIAKKAKFKISMKYIKYALLFNVPLILHYLAQYILRSTDKIMITRFIGEGATGIYSLASTIASIATLAWSAMNASLTPIIYENLKEKNYSKINNAVIGVTALFGVCCICVSMIGPEVVFLLGSSKYMGGIYLIPPISASCLLMAAYSNYASLAFYNHKSLSTSIMTIIAALVNLILNYILIPRYGYIAAAYTTEISYFIYTVLHYINYRRIAGKEKIFDDFANWIIIILITILCLLSGLLYPYFLIRLAILIIVFILFIKKRNVIIKIMFQRGDIK